MQGRAKWSYFFLEEGLLGRCVRTDAATDLTGFGVFGLLKSFDAILATRFEVFSFDIIFLLDEGHHWAESAGIVSSPEMGRYGGWKRDSRKRFPLFTF